MAFITFSNPDHVRAFAPSFTAIWGTTKFANEVNNLAYFRAMTCFLGNEEEDIADRRKLVYSYLQNDFASSEQADTINQLYNILPVEESVSRVLRNLCTLYNEAPNRKFDSDKVNEVYDKSGINSALLQAHRMAKFCNSCLVMPSVRDGKIEFDIYPPDLFRVETDPKDFKKITEIWVPISTMDAAGDVTYSFKVWTNELYWNADIEGKTIEGTEEPNRYGRIPAVVLQFNHSRTNFYGGGLWELVLATLDDNKLCFLVNNDVVYSSFSIWVATNFDAKTDLRLAPNKLLRITGAKQGEGESVPAQIESIHGQGSFTQIEELRDSRQRRAMRKLGLPESLVSSNPGLAASGVSMQVDRLELQERRKEDITVMSKFERDFYPILAAVVNRDLGIGLPENSNVGIDYVEQSEYIDPAVKSATIKEQFEAGIIGAKDYLSNFTKNEMVTTDEEAINYMVNNLTLYKRLKDAIGTSDNTGQTASGTNTSDAGGGNGQNSDVGGNTDGNI